MSGPLNYREPTTIAPREQRSLGKWSILILVWIAGTIMWLVYMFAFAWLLLRVL